MIKPIVKLIITLNGNLRKSQKGPANFIPLVFVAALAAADQVADEAKQIVDDTKQQAQQQGQQAVQDLRQGNTPSAPSLTAPSMPSLPGNLFGGR